MKTLQLRLQIQRTSTGYSRRDRTSTAVFCSELCFEVNFFRSREMLVFQGREIFKIPFKIISSVTVPGHQKKNSCFSSAQAPEIIKKNVLTTLQILLSSWKIAYLLRNEVVTHSCFFIPPCLPFTSLTII